MGRQSEYSGRFFCLRSGFALFYQEMFFCARRITCFFFNVILLGNFPYLNGGYVCCSAFVDYLTPSASYFWPSYLSFCDIGANPKSFLLESLVLNFLQLILRCVRAEPSVGLSLKVYAH